MKIIVYGTINTGRDTLAGKMSKDNGIETNPVELRDPACMASFLAAQSDGVAIAHAETADILPGRYQVSKRDFANVLMVPAPRMYG